MDPREVLTQTLHVHWPAVRLGEELGGGARNLVVEGTMGGKRLVVRMTRRSDPALKWELQLIHSLYAAGVVVPVPLPSITDRFAHDRVSVITWVDGEPPQSADDWRRVEADLNRIHSLTRGWPQRPDFASTRDLIDIERGGDIDLSLLPADAVVQCREAFRAIRSQKQSVVHGDPGAQNLRLTAQGVGFIDWDEARVDASILDFAAKPLIDLALTSSELRTAVERAGIAWETANGWTVEPQYARQMLKRLLAF